MRDFSTTSVQTGVDSRSRTRSSTRPERRRPSSDAVARDDFSRRVSIFTAVGLGLFAVFGLGIHFAQAKYWPYKPIADAAKMLEDAIEYGAFAPDNALGDAPPNASREAYTVHAPDRIATGYRAAMGYLTKERNFGIWIFDQTGEQVHQRILNYAAQDPDGPTGGSEAPHAFHFLEDGSVVVNTDKGDVMARYDVCGDAIWTRHGSFHHSLASDPRGGLWTWRGATSAFDQYQYLVRFDPLTGETIEEVSLVDDIIMASPANQAIFTIVPGYSMKEADGYRSVPDLFHPNDLEVLQPEMADAFPEFEAGDLLMSFRNIDLITVIDPETYVIKWWSHGPWIQQHDPDFDASGEITLFNNNGWRKASNIVAIDPMTRTFREVPIDPAQRFYSQYMGKHEYLDNGTLQVVVPFEGRMLEFDRDGELLLEINNVHSPDHNAFVADYTLLATDFFDMPPAEFDCSKSAASPVS